jgi:hypothetical protein
VQNKLIDKELYIMIEPRHQQQHYHCHEDDGGDGLETFLFRIYQVE